MGQQKTLQTIIKAVSVFEHASHASKTLEATIFACWFGTGRDKDNKEREMKQWR